ncbi:MAG: DUF3108 domain-containing protein [Pseudomonadota bacterium]
MSLRFFLLLCGVISLGTAIQADQVNYKVRIGGFYAGILSVADAETRSRYSVSARVESAGIAAFFGKTIYEGNASGRISKGRLFPSKYRGFIKSGDISSTVGLSYRNGVPRIVAYDPSPPPEVFDFNFSSQRGTVDMLSSAYWVFRERPLGELCDFTIEGFDGRRSTQIQLNIDKSSEDVVTCTGAYTRIAGFSERALKRGRVFPLTIKYVKSERGYILDTLTAKTVFGNARVTRLK